MNHKENDIAELRINEPIRWHFHPTEPDTVDAAVAGIGAPWNDLVWNSLPVSMFLTDENIKNNHVGIGDIVFMTGLFTKMKGKKRNFPIVRMGNIAMIPSEKVPGIEIVKDQPVESEVYLIEARSVGGLSGSPVFVRETVEIGMEVDNAETPQMNIQAPGGFYLLGLAHGHWDVKEDEINYAEFRPGSKERHGVNVGIAIVVPAKKIYDILYSETLVKLRQDALKSLDTGTSTPDAVRLSF